MHSTAAGPAGNGRALARQGRLDEALTAFLEAVRVNPADLDAHLGIYEVAQILRREELALAHQRAAIALAPVHSTPASEREDYALLVPSAPGPYTANTPADLLFDPRHVTLHRWYVDPDRSVPALPEHDAVFVAIGESDHAAAHLDAAERFAAASARPVINGPARIRLLGRVPLAETFARATHVRAVTTTRIARDAYARDGFPTPHIVRPVDAHGGHGLCRIDDDAQRAEYLALDARGAALRRAVRRLSQRGRLLPQVPHRVRRRRSVSRSTSRSRRTGWFTTTTRR